MFLEPALWIGAAIGGGAGALLAWAVVSARLRAVAERAESLAAERDRASRRAESLEAAAASAAAAVRDRAADARRLAAEPPEPPAEPKLDPAPALERLQQAAAEARAGLERGQEELAAALEALATADPAPDPDGERPYAAAAELAGLAEATVGAAAALAEALSTIHDSAAETAELSTQVSGDAERGYTAVHKTLDEIERIRALTGVVRTRIDALGERMAGIGTVVRVIQDVTEKTNLLALNASIIAAQAGQHGKSFAIVAREIKALAQQTEASTKEIAEQIAGVQVESSRVSEAMADGVQAVSDGFQVAIAAGDALESIRKSARSAQKRVQSMNRTVKRQAVSETVLASARATAEHAASLARSLRAGGEDERRQRLAADRLAGAADAALAALTRDQQAHAAAAAALGDCAAACRTLAEQRATLAAAVGRAGEHQRAARALTDRLVTLWRDAEAAADALRRA